MRRYPAPAGRVRHRGDRPGRPRGARGHLASRERCRDELAALPALLRRLPAKVAAQPSGESAAAHERDAGEALLGRMLGRMAVRRRRRR